MRNDSKFYIVLLLGWILSFSTSCNGQKNTADNVLFGISEQYERLLNSVTGTSSTSSSSTSAPACSTDITVTTKEIFLAEDGDVTAVYSTSTDNNLTETDTDGGTSWGYRSFETCIYPNTAFTGSIEIPISSNGTYTGRITSTQNTAPNVGQPLPQTLTFSAEGVANRKCFLFTRANDAVRNTKENPLVISLGKVVQKNAGGSVVSGFYTDKDPCDISVIQDDDEGPGIRVSNISQVMEEPGSSVQAENRGTFRVVLRTAPTANVTIPMSETADSVNSGNREGTMAPTSLTFTTGNWNIEQVVTVTSVDDQEIDGLKTYIVRTQSTSSSDSEYNGIDPRDVVIYNKDKSVPGYAFEKWDATTQTFTSTGGSSTGYATDEANQMGTTYSTIKIKLRTKPTANVTLSFSTNCGTKCSIVSPNMTFTTSNWNDYQTLQVQGAADGADGGNQDYNVTLTASSTDTTYNTTVTEPSIVIRSCDNDNTRLIQPCNFSGSPFGTSGSRLSGAEPSATTRIWLIAKASPSSDITVGTTSTDTTEGTVPVSVSVTSSNYNRMMTGGTNQITLTHVDDTLVDGSQNWTVTTATSTGGLSYNPLDIEASTTDNEAYFYVNVSGTTREGTTNAATISVCLGANNADTTVTLNIACTVASDECGTLSASSITFPINSRVADANASNSGCPNDANKQTFTVQGFDDTFADGTQSFTVSLTKAANADGNYSSAPNPTSPSVNNEDNEPAGKAIFVTTSTYNGEMTAQGVVGADNNCNTNKPGYAPSGTYKALLVSDSGGGANNPVNDRKVGTNWVISPGLYYYRCESGANNCRDEGNRLFIADGSGSFNPTTMSTDFSSNGAHEFWTGLTTGMAPATQAATPAGCVTLNYKHNCHGFTYQNCDASPFQDLYGTTWIRNAAGSVTTTDRVCTGSYRLICVQQ